MDKGKDLSGFGRIFRGGFYSFLGRPRGGRCHNWLHLLCHSCEDIEKELLSQLVKGGCKDLGQFKIILRSLFFPFRETN
jgi:hypothetical protein